MNIVFDSDVVADLLSYPESIWTAGGAHQVPPVPLGPQLQVLLILSVDSGNDLSHQQLHEDDLSARTGH